MGGKLEKSDRRRHADDRDRTGSDGERSKKSDKHRDDERRDKRHDDTTESHHSKKVSCRCCFHLFLFLLLFVSRCFRQFHRLPVFCGTVILWCNYSVNATVKMHEP